jgi:PAS domain S-box-containing protein
LHTIVLVDDAADIRRLVRLRLNLTHAFEVVGEGSNGLDAVALAAEHRPDLMLLDVSMAGMDGLEAIPLVATASPKTKIVMFSGFDEAGLAERAISFGASAFIQKADPIADLPDRLLALVGAPSILRDETPPDRSDVDILTQHTERFQAAFEQAAIGMATMTLTGRIVRANPALARLLGSTPQALVGTLFADHVMADDLNEVNAALLRVASGVIDADDVTHGVVSTRKAWGVSTFAVVRDTDGVPLYLFVQVQDITERRVTEERLRQSEERFRLLVEGVKDYAIFMLDPGGHIASWNPGAERIKGWTAAEVIGQHFRLFYTDEARDRKHPEYELEVAKAQGRYEEEGWRVRKDGTTFWANVVITPLWNNDGELAGFAKVTRDVTDRHEVFEERGRIARERTEFLAMTAHELRGPIGLLQGFADLLQSSWRDLDDTDRDDMLLTVARTSKRLRRLVDDLLTASRLESGVLEVRPEEVELLPLLQAAVQGVSAAVAIVCPPELRVLADTGRLHQMLGNYVTNAIRYGAPPFEVRGQVVGDEVEIAVTDHGQGVREEVAERLFAKFAHGDHEESTGLGLFIVRELARAQGGDAYHEAPTVGGARFVLRLPLASSR